MIITLPYYDVAQAFREAEKETRDNAKCGEDSINPYRIALKLLRVVMESEDFGEEQNFHYEFEVEYE